METNVQKIPAGIMNSIEAFVFDGKKYLVIDGRKIQFKNAPGKVQRLFANAFMADKAFQRWMKQQGVNGLIPAFEKWFFCKFGAYDGTPDVDNGVLVPDAFNSACTDYNCEMRGRMCGNLGFALHNHEVKTLMCLINGFTIEETADYCCLSVAGIKSRIGKLKEEFGARNTAQLCSIAARIGLQATA